MDSGQVSESASLSASPLAGNVKVLDEGVRDGLYQVRIQLDPVRRDAAPASCAASGGRNLRRSVVAAYFTVDHPIDASDLDSLGMRLPHELATRMARSGSTVSASEADDITVMSDPRQTDPARNSANVRQLAQARDAQFVVTGRVISTAVTDRAVRMAWFESALTSQQGEFYNGPFSAVTGGALKYRAVARQFDMELWVYDGLTGAVLLNQRMTTQADGDVQPATPPQFASDDFWRSDYGRALSPLLDQAAERVVSTVSCLPFSTRVARVNADGRQVYLAAGGMDGLQVGDKLLIFRQLQSDAVQLPSSGRLLGIPESLIGDVSVIQVQPDLSVAVVQSVRGRVMEGDLVRFIPKR
jgi:hypothetical protein